MSLRTRKMQKEQVKLLSAACDAHRNKNQQNLVITYESIKDATLYVPKNYDSIQELITLFAEHYKMGVFLIFKNQCYESGKPNVYLRIDGQSSIRMHKNLGCIVKLPSGVGKFDGPLHNLNEILKRKKLRRKNKYENFSYDSNLDKIEKDLKIGINIWQKCRKNFSNCDIKVIRKGKGFKKQIKLHLDVLTKRLFLIQNEKLYFRGFIKSLKLNHLSQ